MNNIKKKIISFIIPIIIFFLVGFAFGVSVKGASYKNVDISNLIVDTFAVKETAHEIAQLARSIGLPEDDPIIIRAKELWEKADEQFCNDRDIIATVVYNEAGYGCSDRHMELVAAVVYNRVKSDSFPDTVYDVVVKPKQYHPAYAKANSYYGKRARESEIWTKCQEIATKALKGEIECPEDVVYQANFVQGSEIYEIHYTSYSTTWFCYK